ncbi:3-hydroxyacyl-CoA dehydrogenase family protein [Candidatus Poribacteria bacterium]
MNTSDIHTVGVIGAGTMGAGIAQSFAEGGYHVICCDTSESAIERGTGLIRLNQDTLIKNGILTKEHADSALERLKTTLRLEDLANVDFVCEAVVEDIEAKKSVFSRVDGICREDTILTSNTSGLSITEMATAVSSPRRFAGMHWWNPPHIMPLIEVIKGDKSSEETCMIVMDICRKLGKKPVLVKKDIPGFIGNRLQVALLRETMNILDMDAATPEAIDTVVKYGPGARWALYGPCEIADLGGLDVFNFIAGYLFRDLSSAQNSPDVLKDKVSKGELGTKTGKGFYEYEADQVEKLIESRDRRLLKIFGIQQQD